MPRDSGDRSWPDPLPADLGQLKALRGLIDRLLPGELLTYGGGEPSRYLARLDPEQRVVEREPMNLEEARLITRDIEIMRVRGELLADTGYCSHWRRV